MVQRGSLPACSPLRSLMRLLFVAAARMEFHGLLKRVSEVHPARLPVDWARTARLGGHDVLLAANGAGARRTAAAADAALPDWAPDAIVSTGFCGALAPELALGGVVVGASIASAGRCYPAQPVCGGVAHLGGVIYSVDHVVETAAEKRHLRRSGAIAVEMEAAGLAERARQHRLPFYCVRAVTDLAGENLANDFNGALRLDGHFDTMLILRGTFRKPLARLPELVRLRSRCGRAARILGDFFADCRF